MKMIQTLEKTFKSKQAQVFEFLQKELREGKYKPGARFVSENDLLKSLDVSRNTLREALTALVKDGYLKRIQGNGTFVTGKILREKRKTPRAKTLALIANNPHAKGEGDPFISAVLSGAHAALEQVANWNIKLVLTDGSDEDTARVCEKIAEEGSADAAICAGFNVSSGNAGTLMRNGIRCVSIGQPETDGVDFVDSDNREGMRATVESLIRAGHRRIAFADRSFSHRKSYESRKLGYADALREHGIEPDPALSIEFKGLDAKAGAAAAVELLSSGKSFTAAVVYGDWPTMGFLRELERRGIKVPDDVSLISFSSFNWISQACGMEITHVKNPLQELGSIAAKIATGAKDSANAPRSLPMELEGGESVAAPKMMEDAP